MATAKKTAKKATKAAETNTLKARAFVRKGALAYVGLYGAAYERAQLRWNQLRTSTDGLFDTLVVKGEEIESKAGVVFKTTQTKVTERFEEGTEKVRSILPVSANDRVEEMEAEIKALNKKIVALGKKAKTSTKAKLKTEKTVKAKTATKAETKTETPKAA